MAGAEAEQRWGAGRALLVLLALALALKLCVVLAPPPDLGPQGKGMAEELWRGVAAQDLLDGPLLPIQDYQVNDFSGGSLVIALLAVPLYALLGPELWVLRLTTALFNLLALACAFMVLERYAGRRAAWSGGVLFALVPPGYAIVSTTAWGTHLEGNALAMALLLAFLRYREGGGARALPSFGIGVLAGFCLYFGYVAAVTIATLALFELALVGRALASPTRPGLAAVAARVLGLLVGLLPWLRYNVLHGWRGLLPYSRPIGERVEAAGSLGAQARAAGELFTDHLPSSSWQPDLFGLSGEAIEAVSFAALALISLAALLPWRGTSTPAGGGRGLEVERAHGGRSFESERANGGRGFESERACGGRGVEVESGGGIATAPEAAASAGEARGESDPMPSRWSAHPRDPRLRAWLPRVLLLYPLVYALFYAASDFRAQDDHAQNLRYVMPVLPWLFLAVGIGAQRLADLGRGGRGIAWTALLVWLVPATAGTLTRCDFAAVRESLALPGTSHAVLGRTIAARYDADREALGPIVERLISTRPLEIQDQVLFAMGQTYKYYLDPRTRLARRNAPREEYGRTIDFLRERVPERFRPYFERPHPGERIYAPFGPQQIDAFWRDRRVRETGR